MGRTREKYVVGRWRDGVVLKKESWKVALGKSYLWELVPGVGKCGLA
jgi:hypothetical protein